MRVPVSPPQKKDFECTDEGLKWLELLRSKSLDIRQVFISYNPTSIDANTSEQQTLTLTGLKADDLILRVYKPHTAGLIVNDGQVTADNTLGINFANVTGSPIDPGEETYTVIYIKNSRL